MKTSQKITTFFTFCGKAEEAINFYVSFFPDAKINSITYFSNEERGEEGKVLNGMFELMGQPFIAMDIEQKYGTGFSWATSQFVHCKDKEEFDLLFTKLSEAGVVMMGPESVLHIQLVAWVTDKFGVTWQLVWE